MDLVNILISGGAKNGKSYYAQLLAKHQANNRPLYYIATMNPVDDEDQDRIKRHRQEREGWGFITIEKNEKICDIQADMNGSFLLDSVTALLSNEMFRADGSVDRNAYIRVATELLELAKRTGNTVFVSDYIYSDAFPYDDLTELYRKGLAYIDCALAKYCDIVLEATFGNIVALKGEVL